MSEHNSTPDQSPTSDSAPAGSNPTAPTQAYPAETVVPTTTSEEKPAKRRGRTALIAGGAALGAILLVGGGAAIGAAVADGDDDDDRVAGLVADEQSASDSVADDDGTADQGSGDVDSGAQGSAAQGADDDGTDDRGSDDASAASGTVGTTSADELDAIARAAASVAEGEPVSIDANRDGSWDVKLRGTDGSEAEVLVSADGTATVRETEGPDDDDRAPENILDAATLNTIVAAALAEADGRVIEIDADDDGRSPFDVTIVTADRQIVEITLDESGAVIGTEIDD